MCACVRLTAYMYVRYSFLKTMHNDVKIHYNVMIDRLNDVSGAEMACSAGLFRQKIAVSVSSMYTHAANSVRID